jgi:hypothetical protein
LNTNWVETRAMAARLSDSADALGYLPENLIRAK